MARKDSTQQELPFLKERQQFRALLLSNPNYFGNLGNSPFKPKLEIIGNNFYEELGCVGFQPQLGRLEAVVFVKQPFGYGGGLCSQGTQEYVRFFISYDNGVNWQDLGMSSFTARDVPQGTEGGKRLEYDVSVDIQPPKKWCFIHNFARVRAILSWNDPVPPDPDHRPIWGDVHNTVIQIDGFKLIKLYELLHEAKVKLPSNLEALIDPQQSISLAKPELSLLELSKTYGDKVEPHRFALKELNALVSQQTLSLQSTSLGELLPGVELDLSKIIDQLFPKEGLDGNTSYEQLECIGYNPVLDSLAGVIRVKLPSGYSGGPCTAGSKEYVAFWADLDGNGTFETYLGTTSVTTHDFSDIPKEGLEYAVFLPAALTKYRKPCQEGPVIIPIRAILSWNVPPDPTNPNKPPVWGNHEDTLVLVDPGFIINPGEHPPVVQTVGGMNIANIGGLGLANGAAATAGVTATDSPFGGEVVITGRIVNPTDISAGAAKLKYRVELSKFDPVSGTWGAFNQFVSDSFNLGLDSFPSLAHSNVLQSVDAQGFFEYQEDLTGPDLIFPSGNVLARWQTSGNDLWRLRVRVKDPGSLLEWVSAAVTVQLDNAAPTGGLSDPNRPFIGIDSVNGTPIGNGACNDFTIGDTVGGAYEVRDAHLSGFSIFIAPANGGTFRLTSPVVVSGAPNAGSVGRSYPALPTGGEAGRWEVDTAKLPRCGYTIWITASDRTIVNSGFVGWTSSNVVGLCLRNPGK